MSAPARPLPPLHLLLALAVMVVWGTNFVIIRAALAHIPPLTLAALRFSLALIPAVFLIRRPAVPWRGLATYGGLIGAGQFGMLFLAMRHDISPGLASLVIQTQVFFTLGLAVVFEKEHVRSYQFAALALAAGGLAVILFNTHGDVTPLGLGLTLLAALSWAGGNIASRRAGSVNMLAFVVWGSLFSVPPLIVLALIFEGWPAMRAGVTGADWTVWVNIAWQAWGNTLFGYGAWAWLLSRHPAAQVAPMALLVPVVGLATAAIVFHEAMQPWKILAAGLVLGGLALNLLWPRLVVLLSAGPKLNAPPTEGS